MRGAVRRPQKVLLAHREQNVRFPQCPLARQGSVVSETQICLHETCLCGHTAQLGRRPLLVWAAPFSLAAPFPSTCLNGGAWMEPEPERNQYQALTLTCLLPLPCPTFSTPPHIGTHSHALLHIQTLAATPTHICTKHRDIPMQTYTNMHSFADSHKHIRTPTDTRTHNGLETH